MLPCTTLPAAQRPAWRWRRSGAAMQWRAPAPVPSHAARLACSAATTPGVCSAGGSHPVCGTAACGRGARGARAWVACPPHCIVNEAAMVVLGPLVAAAVASLQPGARPRARERGAGGRVFVFRAPCGDRHGEECQVEAASVVVAADQGGARRRRRRWEAGGDANALEGARDGGAHGTGGRDLLHGPPAGWIGGRRLLGAAVH
eukprot:350156-Chlamydomonas_euryale.AAC.6